MSSPRTRRRPMLDELEGRLALSVGPSNTLGVASGVVEAPRSVAAVSVPVSAGNINGRHSIVIGESISPTSGSALEPKAVAVLGPNGENLPARHGAPFVPGAHGSSTLFVRDGTPGPVTTAVTGRRGTAGPFQLRAYLPGDVTGTGQVTLADLKAFSSHFLTTTNNALYSPLADANQNGRVGFVDAKYIARNLAPLTPKGRMFVNLTLAPGDAVKGHHSNISGGATAKQTVTILGRTVPGSVVFSDSGLGDYTFSGPVLPTDAHGNFSVKVTNREGLNNYDFLAISPYGQQKIQDFPIFWTAFAAPGSKLK